MRECEHILDLGWWRRLIENTLGPLFTRSCAGELDSVTSPVLAVDMNEEQVSMLQLINQTQRNIDESSLC